MIKLEFDFGIGERANGEPLDAETAVVGKAQLLRYVSELAGGCSLIVRDGAWLHEGRLIVEPGYTLVVLTESGDLRALAPMIVRFIKRTFDQKAVFVTRTVVDAELL